MIHTFDLHSAIVAMIERYHKDEIIVLIYGPHNSKKVREIIREFKGFRSTVDDYGYMCVSLDTVEEARTFCDLLPPDPFAEVWDHGVLVYNNTAEYKEMD